MNKTVLLAIITFFNCFFTPALFAQHNKWAAPVLGVTAVVGGSYLAGRGTGNIILHYIDKWYTPDYEKLIELNFDTQKINNEFISYIKEKHHDNYFLWIDFNGALSEFPLLKYKFDLDRYIRLSHFFRIFVSSSARGKISDLIIKMKKLREVVMGHPDYLEERKLYVRLQAVPHVYVNNFGH